MIDKIHRFSKLFFFTFLSLIFLTEGTGIKYGHELSYFLLLIFPFFLFFIDFIVQKKILIPKKIFFLFALFLFFVGLSTFFAVNIQRAFEGFLYYVSVLLIFLYVYNHKDELLSGISKIVIIFGLIFSAFSFFLYFLPPDKIDLLLPTRGYQYVYRWVGHGHNSLGSFLLIVLILVLYKFIQTGKIRYIFLFFLFFPQFLLSFDKSAYLAFIVSALLILIYQSGRKKIYKKYLILLTIIFVGIFITVIFNSFTFSLDKREKILKPISSYMKEKFNLKERNFLSGRWYFYNLAIFSIKDKPLFGFGTNNFRFATQKLGTRVFYIADTSHNILLDFFAENGIPVGLVYIIITGLFLTTAIKNLRLDPKNNYYVKIYSLLSISFLILFQTDFSLKFYSFFLLYFILLGLVYEEREKYKIHKFPLFISSGLLIIAILIITSNLLVTKKNHKLALYLYPFNGQAYIDLINKTVIKNSRNTTVDNINLYMYQYNSLFKEDPSALSYLALKELNVNNNIRALIYSKKAYMLSPLDSYLFERAYKLQSDLYGQKSAKYLADTFLSKLEKANMIAKLPNFLFIKGKAICYEAYVSCPYNFLNKK